MSLQDQIDAIYDDVDKECSLAESYEEISDIIKKGQQRLEQLLNTQNNNDAECN